MNGLPEIEYGPNLVWYAAYGSNLQFQRFMCYITGDKPPGASIKHSGMQDKTRPALDLAFYIPRRIYFADYTDNWQGGVAFISPAESSEEEALCRIYLIKLQQFKELFAQENRIQTDKVNIDFDKLNSEKHVISGNGWYRLALHLGEKMGRPIYTFTRPTEDQLEYTRPSKNYLETIINGLIECWSTKNKSELIEYLCTITRGTYNQNQLADLFDACQKKYIDANRINDCFFRVEPTDDREGNAREFIAQLSEKSKDLFGLKAPDALILEKQHDSEIYRTMARLNDAAKETPEHVIRIDQKLRVALGTRVGDWILAKKPSTTMYRRRHTFFERLIGTQPELMRVHRANFEDMEIPVCRIAPSTFEVIGAEPGSFICLKSTDGTVRVRALSLTAHTWNQRINLLKFEHPDHPSPRKMLHLDRLTGAPTGMDLPPIFLDLDLRKKLRVKPCDCVRVTRDPRDSCISKLYLALLPVTLALIAAAMTFDLEDNIRSIGNLVRLIILLAGVAISIIALLLEVRSKIK